MTDAPPPALVHEALRRSDVAWVQAGTQPPRLAWHVFHDDAVLVVTAPGAQQIPALEQAAATGTPVRLLLRSHDDRRLLASIEADAESLPAGSPAWQDAAGALAGARRWQPTPHSTIWRLRPRLPGQDG